MDGGSLRSGEVNVLRVTGAEPGVMIRIYYGRKGGGAFVTRCAAD